MGRIWEAYQKVCFSQSDKYVTLDGNAKKLSSDSKITWRI